MYKSVLDYFEETVKRVPEKKAIRHNEDDCTFAMLQEQAQKLGSYMIELVGDIKNRPIVDCYPNPWMLLWQILVYHTVVIFSIIWM